MKNTISFGMGTYYIGIGGVARAGKDSFANSLLNLIKNDFLSNLDKMNLPNNIYTHMKNLTISIFRYKLSLANYKKQAQR